MTRSTRGRGQPATERVVALTPAAQRIAQWLEVLPQATERLVIVARAHVDVTLTEWSATEVINQRPAALAAKIAKLADDYADAEGRGGAFGAYAYGPSGAVLATTHWRVQTDDSPTTRLDGTLESSLALQQAHLHAVMRVHLEQSAQQAALLSAFGAALSQVLDLARAQTRSAEQRAEAAERERDVARTLASGEDDGEGQATALLTSVLSEYVRSKQPKTKE